MTEAELLADVLVRLNNLQIPYMLTGSMASNYWGIPRTTHDLDFVIALPPEKIDPLADTFQSDYFIDRLAIRSAYAPPYQFNAIDLRSALKVDFWMLKADEIESLMFSRRQEITLFKTPAWISSAEDTLLHKLFWHSLTPSDRQLGDAAGIWAVQGNSLEMAYLKETASKLQVDTWLNQILEGSILPKAT